MSQNEVPLDINGQKVSVPIDPDLQFVNKKFGFSDVYDMIKGYVSTTSFADLKLDTPLGFVLVVGTTVILILLVKGLIDIFLVDESKLEKKEKAEPIVPRDFTLEQLRDFNGADDKPIYVALEREVYDVTEAKEFYGPGACYSCFAGRESSRAMARLSFTEEDLANCQTSDLSPFEKDTLYGWIEKFKYYKAYPIMGKVSEPPEPRAFTREELLKYKGIPHPDVPADKNRIDLPIYIGVNGKVFDVSYGGKEMYSPGGPYGFMAGKDASRALAKMSFKPEDIANHDISDLTEKEKVVLQEWEDRYTKVKKYPIVGHIVE